MPILEIAIRAQGVLAQTTASEAATAAVMGVTSRGIFLRTDLRWVVFLSFESYRGPLTFNLERPIPDARLPEMNGPVQIHPGRIEFPASNLALTSAQAAVWDGGARPLPILTRAERRRRITAAAHEVLTQRGSAGLNPLLADLLDLAPPPPSSPPVSYPRVDIRALHKTLHEADGAAALAGLEQWIGLGSGLTPSGDDLISGFLLAHSRYADLLQPAFDLPALRQALIEQAYRKTSRLSANLIECAGQGLGDERLLLALDGLLAGSIDPASSAKLLLSWGNSSGGDALLGMALAINPV